MNWIHLYSKFPDVVEEMFSVYYPSRVKEIKEIVYRDNNTHFLAGIHYRAFREFFERKGFPGGVFPIANEGFQFIVRDDSDGQPFRSAGIYERYHGAEFACMIFQCSKIMDQKELENLTEHL